MGFTVLDCFPWLTPSTTQGALSTELLDEEDSYFPNVRLKIQDLAHAIRRQIQLFVFCRISVFVLVDL